MMMNKRKIELKIRQIRKGLKNLGRKYRPERQQLIVMGFILGIMILFTVPSNSAMAGKDLLISPTPLPDPLSTPLPTAQPIPITARRPPLYPVPWALKPYDHFYFTRPVAPDQVNWPLSAYKFGATNFSPNLPHTGVDIVVEEGTPVLAAAAGRVVWAGTGLLSGGEDPNDPYGVAVSIQHEFGFNNEPLFTAYTHLLSTVAKKGDWVEAGDLIAFSGQTGNVTGEHLHFEVRLGPNEYYNSVNPELWMVPPVGWGVLAGRVTNSWGNPVGNLQIRITSYETGQRWYPQSYGTLELINSDPYYNENLVLSDLPQGTYEIMVPYVGYEFRAVIEIRPGVVNYFNFQGFEGISLAAPSVVVPWGLRPTATVEP